MSDMSGGLPIVDLGYAARSYANQLNCNQGWMGQFYGSPFYGAPFQSPMSVGTGPIRQSVAKVFASFREELQAEVDEWLT